MRLSFESRTLAIRYLWGPLFACRPSFSTFGAEFIAVYRFPLPISVYLCPSLSLSLPNIWNFPFHRTPNVNGVYRTQCGSHLSVTRWKICILWCTVGGGCKAMEHIRNNGCAVRGPLSMSDSAFVVPWISHFTFSLFPVFMYCTDFLVISYRPLCISTTEFFKHSNSLARIITRETS